MATEDSREVAKAAVVMETVAVDEQAGDESATDDSPAPPASTQIAKHQSEGNSLPQHPVVFPIILPFRLDHGPRPVSSTRSTTFAADRDAIATDAITPSVYWRAGVASRVDTYGCSCTMSTFRARVEPGDFTFLSMTITNDDSSHAEQVIQAGWIRAPSSLLGPAAEADPDLAQLCVFYSTVGSVGAGEDFVQGFNDTVQGWVAIPGAFRPGVDVIPASHIDGTQGSIDLKFQLMTDRWNLRMNGTIIGYYPTSLFTVDRRNPASPPLADLSETLADHGTKVGFFGQVYDSGGGLTSTDMGSGKYPEEGYGKSAFCYKMQYQPKATAQDPTMADADSSWDRFVDDPLRYDCLVSWKSNTWWRSYMYIGGPGCEGTGWSAWDSVGGFFTPACPITALSRRPAVIDLFAIGLDGRVYMSWWEGDDWSGFNNDWWLLDWGGQTFLPQTKIAAVARSPDNLDIFVVGVDFKIYTAWWSEGHGWTGWRNISGNQAFDPVPPLLTAVSRHEGQLDVFVLSSGVVSTSFWTDSVTDWTGISQPWATVGTVSSIPPQLDLVVLSRTPQTMDVITSQALPLSGTDFFWNTWAQDSGWATFKSVGSAAGIGTAIRVTGVASTSNRIDLFAMGSDFLVYTCRWTLTGGWSGIPDKWDRLGDSSPTFGPLCNMAAVSRNSSCVDVFVGGTDGRIYTNSLDRSPFGPKLWSGWTSLRGQAFATIAPFGMAVCSRDHQTLAVVACGNAGKVWASEWLDPACGPRPFYCMAHNPDIVDATKDEVDISLKLGANALGPDVNKSKDSGKLVISHGGLLGLDMGTDSDPDLITYLQHLHDMAVANPQLALVAFDCKPPAHSADNGHDLLMAIRTHLTHDLPLDIVISVPSPEGSAMFDRIFDLLGPREAIAIDEENDVGKVVQSFQDIHATDHAVYGNGSTVQNPLLVPNFRRTLELAVGVHAGQDGLQSVYGWTTDQMDKQQEFIRIGVDGVMSNLYPGHEPGTEAPLQQLVHMVQSDLEIRRLVRMATRNDRILSGPTAGYELVITTGSIGAAGTDADLTFIVRGELGVAKKTVNTSLLGRMEGGGTDFMVICSKDVGDLVDVTVRNDMSRSLLGNSRWRCDSVRVVSARYGVDRTATFGVDVEAIPITRPLV